MKRENIEVGSVYWDGKKTLRKIVRVGKDGWGEDCVDYVQLTPLRNSQTKYSTPSGHTVWGSYDHSFLRWAKQNVTIPACAQDMLVAALGLSMVEIERIMTQDLGPISNREPVKMI